MDGTYVLSRRGCIFSIIVWIVIIIVVLALLGLFARAPLKGWVGGHSVAPDYFCALPLNVSRVRKVLPGLRPETPYETPTGGKPMQIDKQFVVDQLKNQGESAKAQKALDELPAKIDHEQHAALLEKFGIDPGQLAGKAAKKGLGGL